MVCVCCNKILSNQEAVRRFRVSGEFTDMCNKCLSTIEDDVETVDGEAFDDDEEGWDD